MDFKETSAAKGLEMPFLEEKTMGCRSPREYPNGAIAGHIGHQTSQSTNIRGSTPESLLSLWVFHVGCLTSYMKFACRIRFDADAPIDEEAPKCLCCFFHSCLFGGFSYTVQDLRDFVFTVHVRYFPRLEDVVYIL